MTKVDKVKMAEIAASVQKTVCQYVECHTCGERVGSIGDTRAEVAQKAFKLGWRTYYRNGKIACQDCLDEMP